MIIDLLWFLLATQIHANALRIVCVSIGLWCVIFEGAEIISNLLK